MGKQWKQWASKSLGDGDYSHEIKRCLLLGRKAITNLDSILKSRGITLLTKIHLVKAMTFPVVMYGCESWTIRKAECWRIDDFELWCWRRLLRVPWSAEIQSVNLKGNQSWTFIGRTDAEAETPIFGHLMRRTDSLERPWCWERLKAGGEGEERGWDGWMASLIPRAWVWVSSRSWWWTGKPGVLQSMGSQRVGHNWATELNWIPYSCFSYTLMDVGSKSTSLIFILESVSREFNLI